LPPEVLVRTEAGSFHGMPWYQYFNNDFQDGRCASSSSPVDVTRAKIPVALFDARSTPMGIDFPAGNVLDGLFINSAVIAVHGSWGKPPGGGPESRRPPKLMSVDFAGKDAVTIKDLVSGFQRDDGSRFARPVDIKSGPDGNLYFSSDGGEVEGLFRLRLK
jgi:glucose/arabinose dehydrogenase